MRAVIFFILAAVAALLAIALLGASIWGPGKIHVLIATGVQKTIIVDSENASSYDTWRDSRNSDTPPVHMNFYLYNVTNPDEIMNGSKPIIQELGPYSYIEQKVKFNITFLENGTQVQYWQWEFFTYDANNSKPGLNPDNDTITIVSIPLQAVWAGIQQQYNASDATTKLTELLFFSGTKNPFVTSSATNLIFGYYNSTLLQLAHAFDSEVPLHIPLQANETSEEDQQTNTTYTIQYTGKGNLQQIHQYIAWNGQSNLTIWGSEDANAIRGNDGYNFPPNVNKSVPLELFVDNLSRKGFATYNSTAQVFGIELYGFTLNPSQLQNDTENPANAPYYATGYASGLLNMTSASQGIPIFISKPHFLEADPIYIESVDGMANASVNLHDTVLWVEPITGVTMQSYKRLQVNIHMEPIPNTVFSKLPDVYFPVVWLEEGGAITEKLADEFKHKIYTAEKVRKYGPVAGFVVVGVLALLAILFTVLAVRTPKDDEHKPLLRDDA